MKTVKTVWFWWWGWNPFHMENMLERMEADGWNLLSVDFTGMRFKFYKGDRRNVRYGVDYQSDAGSDYLSLFHEDGWQMKWNGAGGWYLWMKPYTSERPEIFSETSSLIDRNNRLLKLLTPLFFMLIAIFMIMLAVSGDRFIGLIWFYIVIITLYTYIIFQLRKYNSKLKDEIRD